MPKLVLFQVWLCRPTHARTTQHNPHTGARARRTRYNSLRRRDDKQQSRQRRTSRDGHRFSALVAQTNLTNISDSAARIPQTHPSFSRRRSLVRLPRKKGRKKTRRPRKKPVEFLARAGVCQLVIARVNDAVRQGADSLMNARGILALGPGHIAKRFRLSVVICQKRRTLRLLENQPS